MKLILAIFTLFNLIACQPKVDTKLCSKTISKKDNDSTRIQYPEIQLINLLDSIGKLDVQNLRPQIESYPDSVYKSQKQLNIKISQNNFEKLKYQLSEGRIETKLFKDIFPTQKAPTSENNNGYIYSTLYEFSETKFEKFAVEISTDGWISDVLFFNKNIVIAKHNICHRYGLEIEHFKNNDGNIIIYYKQNFESGTGIWWWHYNFFMYSDNSLIPVLNELQNANLQYPWSIRSYWYEATVQSTNPLKFKAVYYNELPNSAGPIRILEDSTEIGFDWDQKKMVYTPNYSGSKLNRNKVLSFYLTDNELMFINSNYELLKSTLDDKEKRKLILNYLNEIKNSLKKKPNR